MPCYEFECPACEYKQEEIFLSFEEYKENKPKCKKCGVLTKKIISPISHIIFKGSGFYSTENRRRIHSRGKFKDDNHQVTAEDARNINDREQPTEENYVVGATITPIEGDLVEAVATV